MESKKKTIAKLLTKLRDVDIARKYGVSRQYIHQIRKEKGLPKKDWMPDVTVEYIASTPAKEVMEKYELSYYKYLKLKKRKESESGTEGKSNTPNS